MDKDLHTYGHIPTATPFFSVPKRWITNFINPGQETDEFVSDKVTSLRPISILKRYLASIIIRENEIPLDTHYGWLL